MTQQGAVTMSDYFTQVPGLSINSRGSGRLSIVMRGISAGSGGNPTTAVTVDDVPIGSSTASGVGDSLVPEVDPSELQRIEVLRGPQGTLYGASSLGGLVKFVTKLPTLNQFSGRVEASGETVAHGGAGGGVRAAVNIPLANDVAALSVSGFTRQDPGFIDDSYQHKSDVNWGRVSGGHAALLVKLGPKVSVNLSALIQNSSAGASTTEDVTVNHVPATGDLQHARLPGTDGFNGKLRVYSGAVNADLGAATLTSITAYSQVQHNGPQDVSPTFGRFGSLFGLSFTPGARIGNVNGTDKFSQEVRLASQGSSAFEWLVGGYYTRENDHTHQTITFADPVSGNVLTQLPALADVVVNSRYEEVAGFGSLTYHFTDRFDLQVGGRYAHVTFKANSVSSGPLVGDNTIVSNTSQDVFTFLVTPRYKISDNAMVYARIASGYRPGGSNAGVPGVNQTYDADRTVNYELGYKASLFDRQLTVDVSAFDIEWNKIQLRAVAPNGLSYLGNGGQARSAGAELTTTWKPGSGLTFVGNLAYTDAEMRKASTAGIIAAVGDPLPYSARWTASLSADKRFTLTDRLDGFVGGTFSYVGKRAADFPTVAGTPRFVMPDYSTLDLRAGIEEGRWTVTAFIRNVSDERGFVAGNPRDAITHVGLFDAGVIRPRTFGGSIAATF